MKLFRNSIITCSAVLTLSLPALAGITVNSPANDSDVSTTFKLSAISSVCSSTSVDAMGYSFDHSSDTTVIKAQSIDKSISASTGTHTLHVKSWGPGTACVKDIVINVKSSTSVSTTSSTSIPSYADSVSSIESLGGWRAKHDSGGAGTSTGSMSIVSSPSKYGSSRKFYTTFTNNGTERYSVSFSDNTSAKNIFYDAWIYLTSSASKIGNLEFDVNQTMDNGQTVMAGFQCDGWTGHWAYTVNTGSAGSPKPRWVSKSGTSCNPRNWSTGKWHHVQASMSRDSSGYVTYHYIWLDGAQVYIGAKAFCAMSLGWGDVINTQFQVDGYGSSGSVTAYIDGLKVSVW
ncbi:MAG TPA: hypothetical protein VN708_22785 [Terriglobales bacterium]|nr:hypothetical protein [Terriglobales bacterium]